MNESEAPREKGPAVADREDLYRGITSTDWWVEEESRPSSAAFAHPDFSTDVASIAGSPDYTLAHLPSGSGLAQFNVGAARTLAFDARLEPDPEQPKNLAHANVYCALAKNQRKRAAQKLAQDHCAVACIPDLQRLKLNQTDSSAP